MGMDGGSKENSKQTSPLDCGSGERMDEMVETYHTNSQAELESQPSSSSMECPTVPTPSLSIDWELYAQYLEESDLTDDQKRELIETLWGIVVSCVDLGFELRSGNQMFEQPAVAGTAEQRKQAVAGTAEQRKQAVAGTAEQRKQAVAGTAEQRKQAVAGTAEGCEQIPENRIILPDHLLSSLQDIPENQKETAADDDCHHAAAKEDS